MRFPSSRQAAYIVAVLMLLTLCFTVDASAQRKRTKKSRRVTHPVKTATTQATAAPTPSTQTSDPQIISTADEAAAEAGALSTTNGRRTRRSTTQQPEGEGTKQQVDRLNAQFNAMNEKLSQMERQQRTLVDLERLSRAEARAEALRAQLRDVLEKESELQARAEQLNYELKPEIIERTLAVSGSTRPEDLREQRRRQLESEKGRVQAQLNQLATSHSRLETAIANADAEADRIRARVDATDQPPPQNTTTDGAPATTGGTTTTEPGNGEPD